MKYNPKHQLKVDGKMNEHDAGVVGRRLATAGVIAAILFGAAAIIAALGLWL